MAESGGQNPAEGTEWQNVETPGPSAHQPTARLTTSGVPVVTDEPSQAGDFANDPNMMQLEPNPGFGVLSPAGKSTLKKMNK